MEKMKRLVAMLLCVATILSMVPAEAMAGTVDETAVVDETVCIDHEHDHGEEGEILPVAESEVPTEPLDQGEGMETAPQRETEATESESGAGETDYSVTASCSHSYSYTYSAAGHTQHTKKGTCSKCGATTSAKENHTWSGNQCSLCKCYKPITANGTYDVIATNGVQLYSANNSSSTKVKVVAKGTSITVTSVAAASSGYYWGKVTKVGTATQSSSAWVCMKSSELGTHSHSYSYSYEVTNHSQHTKKGACSKCGATTSAKENHSWSGNQCSLCKCYKPITADGTYDVIASAGVQLYSANNSSSTKVKVVAKGTSITVAAVAATDSGYYWGKVTKIGAAAQSSSLWVCMKSSDLGTHTHSYAPYTYSAAGHTQHTKAGTCKCGATSSVKENHTWSSGKCSLCGCYAPITADGTYDVIADNGIQLYAENNSGSSKVKVVPKGTPITVTNVAAASSGYYWGKVTKVGAANQTTSAWVCMKSSELQLHSHNHNNQKRYEEKSDSQHALVSICACGDQTSVAEKHSFSGGKCSLCGKAEVANAKGGYVTWRDSEGLRADTYESSDSPKSVPKNTYLEISQVITNNYGNYWGKVSSIDGKAPETTMYAYMGNLKSHSHTLATESKNVNNVEHDTITTCSTCNYKKTVRSNHTFSGGKCTLCGGWQAYSADNGYIVINENGVKLYSQRITSGTSQEMRTLSKGTFVQVTEVKLNDAKNYWGKVTRIDNEIPQQTMYIYLGSGQVQPHEHKMATTYPTHRDAWHTEKTYCKDCAYVEKTENKTHTFENGACKYCTHAQVPSTPGVYVTYRDLEPLREGPYESAKASNYQVPKGCYLKITKVETNEYGNYWGVVAQAGIVEMKQTLYVYMDHVVSHTHTLTHKFDSPNNVTHKRTSECVCSYKEVVREAHDFDNNKCKQCGALDAYKEDGTYLVINKEGIFSYSQPITSGSSTEELYFPYNSFLEITDVKLNSADNYWGRVVSYDGQKTGKVMYVYMGRGQVMPHTHTEDFTYSQKSDTQHYKNMSCTVCGYTQTEPTVEAHDFGGGTSCKHCKKEKVSNQSGTYITFRAQDTLRLEPYEDSDKAEKLTTGDCVEIENVAPNKYGNYWGVVVAINGKPPKVSPTYAYMGNLKPHTHKPVTSYKSVNNRYHDVTELCTDCNWIVTQRMKHSYSDGVCTVCTAWQAYEEDGDYITVKDEVPVYSQNITSPESSRILRSLPKDTFVHVVDVDLNSANNYWGRVTRIGNEIISEEMYIYMGRGQLLVHKHTIDTVYTSKSDTQHNVNQTCKVCGYTDTKPAVEDHVFNSAGICSKCKKEEVSHSGDTYVVVRERESLRADRYADSAEVDNRPAGTSLKVTDIQTNKYGNWWARVVKINDEPVKETCYTYLGNLQPHKHKEKTTIETVNNKVHKTVIVCEGCSMKKETRAEHTFADNVCTVCNAWEPHVGPGGYVTIKEEGVPLYSKETSDTDKGSKLLKTLPEGTYIEVKDVKLNTAQNYWGKVTRIGNYDAKETMYVYMGRGQLEIHRERNHVYESTVESINNLKHRATKVCTVCSYTKILEEDHRFGTGEHNACLDCGAWEPYTEVGGYLTVKDGVILYSKRSSDAKSKELKTLPEGTFLLVTEVELNSAGNWWGKVITIDNDTVGKTAMYVYMGRGSLTTHLHDSEYTLLSTSDSQHTYGYRCLGCKCSATDVTEDHAFYKGKCAMCGKKEVIHELGSYVTVRESESLRADTLADSKEVQNVPAGTLIEVSKVIPNKYGNYWGKVSKISGVSVGKKVMYTYLGNLEYHPTHTMEPYWESRSDARHKVGEKCAKCDYVTFTSEEDHTFGSNGNCTKCGKALVSGENGNYVTFRESEPLRASASKDAKALQTVPAGTRLYIRDAKENGYDNWWGIVSQIDGKDTNPKKPMYVYMGNVQRHENHDMQPFCEKKSDLQHVSGLRCTGCNLTQDTKNSDHSFNDSGICRDCSAGEVNHTSVGYLVRTPGNLKKGSGKDTGNVQWVNEGDYLDVTEITTNEYGNWWGRVTSVNGAKPKQTKAYVYMGNLTPHEHEFDYSYVRKDHKLHTVTQLCKTCGFRQTVDSQHGEIKEGKCQNCKAEVAKSTSKGDYETYKKVTLYQDKKLTKPAGITVEAGHLIKITDVFPPKGTGANETHVGQVGQYGDTSSKNDKLYIKMADIVPHTPHTDDDFTEPYWSKCDEYHYRSLGCSLIGCNANQKGKEEFHKFVDGKCECGKTQVATTAGIYRVRSGSDLQLYADRNSSSKEAGTAKAGSIIVVEAVDINHTTGNWWGKVIWYNGQLAAKEEYVYMGSLTPYTRSSSVKVAGSDANYHYLRDGNEIFPEKHKVENGACSSCGLWLGTMTTGLYIVKEQCRIYHKFIPTINTYQVGDILQIKAIGFYGDGWYGLVATCDGAKVKADSYVQLASLTYHGKHVEGSEHWIPLNDKEHTYDVNCPTCGTNKKVKEVHYPDDQGICILCQEGMSFDAPGGFYTVINPAKVYKSNVESSAVLETLPKGTILTVDTVKEKNGFYMGSGIKVQEDGKQTAHKGYIRMSSAYLAVHEHSWGKESVEKPTETGHDVVQTCIVCGYVDRYTVKHNCLACKVCGAGAITVGHFVAKDQSVKVYKDTSGKKVYTTLKEGQPVYVSKVLSVKDKYWGMITQIGERELQEEGYVPMSSLMAHTHKMQYVLSRGEDNEHVYKATCTTCSLTEESREAHNFVLGKCTVCGNGVVPSSVGVYVTTKDLTLHKSAGGTATKDKISKGTHVYIREVKAYEDILWGRVEEAGSESYLTKKWVRMSGLKTDASHTTESYEPSPIMKKHYASYECMDCSCGLGGTAYLDHLNNSAGTCTLCGLVTMEEGIYYITRDNCQLYQFTGGIVTKVGNNDYRKAGTEVEVTDSEVRDGKLYCKIDGILEPTYILWSDLTDHIHSASGFYGVVDDYYHEMSDATGSVCRICGVDIPAGNTKFTRSIHDYENGYCTMCGIPEIPDKPGTYYAPYDDYYVYEKASQFSGPLKKGVEYNAGDKIVITKVPDKENEDGIIWGQVKSGGYVMMRTLSMVPIQESVKAPVLTKQELIDWCVSMDGKTPFYSYNYHTEMLKTIGAGDIILMSAYSRASGVADQIIKWIKEACGDTMARQYYEGQILSLLMSIEEDMDYSASIPYKSELKKAIKLSKTVADWGTTYKGKLKEGDLEAIKKLNANLKNLGDLLDKGEIGFETYTYLVMDFGRMQDVIATARAIQKETISDPDLHRAFDDVILTYEGAYCLKTDQLVAKIADAYGDFADMVEKDAAKAAADIIKELTGFDVTKGWSDFGFVYSAVNYAVDLGMKHSGASDYAEFTLQFMSQISVMVAAERAYSTAVNCIKEGNHSDSAVEAVRRQFVAYKTSMVQLYDAMLSMATNHIWGIGEDPVLITYLQYEKDKLESVCLVNDISQFVNGISLDEFRRIH